ncbi:hypothetical protein [Paenibacillus apiarius]|uniref:hypothetical protein n=1 Tax=Paenibacillus apiarius TaxID=46240 RepID=UPI003B3AD4E2
MEQRIIELEKKVQELEAALIKTEQNTAQALNLISEQLMIQVEQLIEDYKNGFMDVSLKLIAEAKNEKTTTDVAAEGKVDLSDGRYQLFIRDEPAALSDSIDSLNKLYQSTRSKDVYRIVDRSTGLTAITNAWQFPQ